jgi:hypothetical protein
MLCIALVEHHPQPRVLGPHIGKDPGHHLNRVDGLGPGNGRVSDTAKGCQGSHDVDEILHLLIF